MVKSTRKLKRSTRKSGTRRRGHKGGVYFAAISKSQRVPGIPRAPKTPRVQGIPQMPPTPRAPKAPVIPGMPAMPRAPKMQLPPGIPKQPRPPKMPQYGGLNWSRYQAPKEPTTTLGQATYGMRNMFKRAKFAVTPSRERIGSLFMPKNLAKLNAPGTPPSQTM